MNFKRRDGHGRGRCLLCLCSLILVLSLCAACGAKPAQQAAGEPVNLNYGISNAWDSLMPYHTVSGSNYARIVYDKIYDRLAYVQADGTCLPRAASSWESTEDGYAIIFHLNQDAKFHDGMAVTAQSWADTFRLMTDPACDTLGRNVFSCLRGTDETGAALPGEVLGAAVMDEYTLRLTLKTPMLPEEFLVEKNRELYVLPTHLFQDVAPADLMGLPLWAEPIGSGPCKFESELSGSRLVLTANRDYQLGAPGFDTLTMTVMDKSNLLTALIAGDLDYYAFGNTVAEDSVELAKAAGFHMLEGEVPSTFYELMLNNESIPDATVRQAIALALDKPLLCKQTAGTLGSVTDSSILPQSSYATKDKPMLRDVEQARLLLAASGTERVYTLACTAPRAGLASLLQQNLTEAGMNVQIETVDSATMFSGMHDGLYDMAIASHTPNTLPLWFTGSRLNSDSNLFRIADLTPYATELTAIQAESEIEKRKLHVEALEQILREQQPFVPLWFSTSLYAESKTVTGIDYPASSFSNENVWQWVKTQA